MPLAAAKPLIRHCQAGRPWPAGQIGASHRAILLALVVVRLFILSSPA